MNRRGFFGRMIAAAAAPLVLKASDALARTTTVVSEPVTAPVPATPLVVQVDDEVIVPDGWEVTAEQPVPTARWQAYFDTSDDCYVSYDGDRYVRVGDYDYLPSTSVSLQLCSSASAVRTVR